MEDKKNKELENILSKFQQHFDVISYDLKDDLKKFINQDKDTSVNNTNDKELLNLMVGNLQLRDKLAQRENELIRLSRKILELKLQRNK